jgi:hypothetical protein
VAVEKATLSTIFVPCKNGSTRGGEGLLPGPNNPYDYNEVLND